MHRMLAAFFFALIMASPYALRADDTGTPGQNTHRIAGIGVMVRNDAPHSERIHKYILVMGVQDHSPALEQGVQAADEIVAIDNFPVAGLDLKEAVGTRLRGEQDSVVQLTVKRPGQAKLLSFSLIRKIIPAGDAIRLRADHPFSS